MHFVDYSPPVYTYQAWPAWFYGPDGESAVFDRAEDVPDGWTDNPNSLPEAFQVDPPAEPARRGRPPKAEPEEMQF